MSAQQTSGPWESASLLRKPGELKARLCVWRERLGTSGVYLGPEYLRDEAGTVRTFASLEEARAAIAKATGGAL